MGFVTSCPFKLKGDQTETTMSAHLSSHYTKKALSRDAGRQQGGRTTTAAAQPRSTQAVASKPR